MATSSSLYCEKRGYRRLVTWVVMVAFVCLAVPYGYVALWNLTARVGTMQVRDAILRRIDQLPGDGQGVATATSPGPFVVIVTYHRYSGPLDSFEFTDPYLWVFGWQWMQARVAGRAS